jgi:medium-chain acyl-[acyl-carrier-protein] hydrolase
MTIDFKDVDKNDGSLFEKRFTITTYNLDMKFLTTMPVFSSYFYEVGMEHGTNILKDIYVTEDIVFVATRFHVRIERYPALRENVLVRSWLSPIENRYVIRNYLLIDDSGEIFGRTINFATTFNLKKRESVDLFSTFDISKVKTLDLEPALPIVYEKLPDVVSSDYENKIDVRYFDCDIYRHVNNVKYVEWCIETLPVEFIKQHKLYEMIIDYKRESSLGEKLIAKTGADFKNNTFIHSIAAEDGAKDIIKMKSIWV